ncbi:MAG: hypothetical protein COB78_10850 [Hyphomicrobiales bacterium]|nr:MAG: hypothetical protein COB78_10850 [Hyphomicrobiales bacterium]
MPSTETSIWLALRGQVESLVLDPIHAVSYPNEAFTPPTDDTGPMPYLVVTHLPNTTNRPFIGSDDEQQFQGILQIAVMSKPNQDSSVAVEYAGQVADHFATGLILKNGSARVRITKRADISQGFAQNGLWMTPVSIQYLSFN